MYLLDTDIVIYSLKGHATVKKNLERNRRVALKISIITLMELYYGAYKSQQVAGNLAKIKRIEDSLEIIHLGRESSEIFAMLKAGLEKAGTPLDDFDLILAVCALSHDLVLVTNNLKHFERIEGLKLENWTRERH
ncbi:MAG: type II toxin-antitoxin system VapC family toxin [Desulfobacterales bacterium]